MTDPSRLLRGRRRADMPRDWEERCGKCGYAKINVRHHVDPADQPEGKAYYDTFRSELHEFVPSGKYVR